MMYIDQRLYRSDPRPRNAKTRPMESIEDERMHPDSASAYYLNRNFLNRANTSALFIDDLV